MSCTELDGVALSAIRIAFDERHSLFQVEQSVILFQTFFLPFLFTSTAGRGLCFYQAVGVSVRRITQKVKKVKI